MSLLLRTLHTSAGGATLVLGLTLGCTSDRVVEPPGPLPGVPALDQVNVRFVKFDLGPASPPVTVHLSNTGEVTLGTITLSGIAYRTGRTGWLSVGITNGADSNSATIVVTPTFAAVVQAAPDSAEVTFAAPGSDSTRTMVVTGQVLPGAEFGFSTPQVQFAVAGSGSAAQSGVLSVYNAGNGGADLTPVTTGVAPGAPWLSIAPGATPGSYTVSANPASLAPGNYTGTLNFAAPTVRDPGVLPVAISVGNPILGVTQNLVPFAGAQGGAITVPAGGVVQDTLINLGTGSLGTLSLGTISYAAGEPTGWLAASLAGNLVSLQPTVGALVAGTYTAVLQVRASGGGGLTNQITVALRIAPITPPQLVLQTRTLTLTATKINCAGVPPTTPCGSNQPGSEEINLFNGGGGDLGGLVDFPNEIAEVYPPGQPTGWLIAFAGGNFVPDAVRIIVPRPNIDALPGGGTFNAKVPVIMTTGLFDTLAITLNVAVGTPPACPTCAEGIPSRVGFSTDPVPFQLYLGSATVAPPPVTVTVSNIGNTGPFGALSLGAAQYTAGQPSGWLTVSGLSSTTAPATFTLSLNTINLPVGAVYTASIPVSSVGAGTSVLTVNVSVLPVPVISLVPQGITIRVNPGASDLDFVTITNIGGGRRTGVSLGAPVYGAGQPTGWLTPTACCEGTAFEVGAVSGGLPPGSYTATVPVTMSTQPPTTAPEATTNLPVTFIVNTPPKPAVLRLGAQTVTVAGVAGDATHSFATVATFNSGSGSLGTLSVDPPAYNPTNAPNWLSATVAGSNIALEARPDGLTPAFDYQATVLVHATGADSAVPLSVIYRINQPVQAFSTPLISFSQDTLRFSYSRAVGPGAGIADTVTVEDARQSTIPLLGLQVGAPNYGGGPTGWIVGAFLGSASGPTSLAVAVKGQNLGVGRYVATLTVSATTPDVVPQSLPVLLEITP